MMGENTSKKYEVVWEEGITIINGDMRLWWVE